MIRWYDYVAAVTAADLMIGFVFNGSIFGGMVAYMIYELWDTYYCQWRRKKEMNY